MKTMLNVHSYIWPFLQVIIKLIKTVQLAPGQLHIS